METLVIHIHPRPGTDGRDANGIFESLDIVTKLLGRRPFRAKIIAARPFTAEEIAELALRERGMHGPGMLFRDELTGIAEWDCESQEERESFVRRLKLAIPSAQTVTRSEELPC